MSNFITHYGKKYYKEGCFYISGDRNSIRFNGYTYSRCKKTNYYKPGGNSKCPYSSLHRAVYIHFKGDIPFKHHVHHIDGNKLNNAVDNLETIDPSSHSKLHNWDMPLRIKKWRSKPENKAVMSKISKQTQKKRWEKAVLKFCESCSKQYKTIYLEKSKYCSGTCRKREGSRRKGAKPRNQLVQSICKNCTISFKTKSKIQLYCTNKCALSYRYKLKNHKSRV